MPGDINNPIFGTGVAPENMTPGQKFAQTTNGNLADYFNNPEKYEQLAQQLTVQKNAQQAAKLNGSTTNQVDKANSDAAYKQVLQKFAQPSQEFKAPEEQESDAKVDMDPDTKDEYDKELVKQRALEQLAAGNGPRGMR